MMRTFRNILFISLLFILPCHEASATNLKQIKEDLRDSVITTKIKTKITKHKNLNPLKIAVSTDHGMVTLQGYVKDKQAYVDMLRLAKTTQGVKVVDADELEIKHVNTVFTDAYITAKIETAILKAKVFDDESIPLVGVNATTTNGVVLLSGSVRSNKSILSILRRAYAVQGVKKIISNLHVRQDVS